MLRGSEAAAQTPIGGTVSVLGTRAMLDYATTRGVDRGALLRELHVPPATLADPESRLPVALDHRIWALAASRAGDPARALGGGRPSLKATSAALRASPRTVQRRLRALGVTHRQLVERVRQDLARRMLDSARLSITEITFLLGFEDVSGFYRAHRRWTGVAPSRVRVSPRS